MNLSKKAILILSVVLSVITLCSCSSKTDLKENFVDYHKNKLDNKTFITSTNKEMLIIDLEKENSSNPKVILTVCVGGESSVNDVTYDWLQLSPEERKSELKECGDMLIQYAKDNNWSNDYYLYVNLCQIYDGCHIVYDYEQDSIWIPNCENTFIKMYEKFNTFYKKDLEKSQEGIDFLVNEDLAYIKHDQVEYNHTSSYSIYISDGKFENYNENDSTKY